VPAGPYTADPIAPAIHRQEAAMKRGSKLTKYIATLKRFGIHAAAARFMAHLASTLSNDLRDHLNAWA